MKSIEPNKLDWLDHFQEHGYAVVKGAIPAERAKSYQQRAFAWLKSFGTALDIGLQELRIERFFPADEATRAALTAAR